VAYKAHIRLTNEQLAALIDQEARRLGMSGIEFEKAYEAGELDKERPAVADTGMLLALKGRER